MRKKMLGCLAAGIAFFLTIPSAACAASGEKSLSWGDNSEKVLELQQALKQKGYFDFDITGYFGDETYGAVWEYQKENGLATDGKVGPETSKSLFQSDYSALITSLSNGASQEGSLLPGDSGDAVALLQNRLKELEYYDYDTVTGYYGPVTEDSVKKFQNSAGLQVNGIADPETLSSLFSDSTPPYTMTHGDSGMDVSRLQDRLRGLGYFTDAPTGYYGSMTVCAVEEFQRRNGLTVDGKAGRETRSALYSDNAAAFPAGNQIAPAIETALIQSKTETIVKALELAYTLLGKDYIYGAFGPNSFDCSGFIYYIFNNAGCPINKMSPSALSNVSGWQKIADMENLVIGDLVFFQSDESSNIFHMGIYVGGGSFIHASQSMGCVTRSTMANGYYNSNFAFAKRIV